MGDGDGAGDNLRRVVLRTAIGLLILGAMAAGLGACATTTAVGRGGQIYAVRVASVNGMTTALRGPAAHPACVVQVANQVATVWLAQPAREGNDQVSPVVFEADGEALKEGILVERSWNQAVVHEVTDAELAAGAALVYVPGVAGRPTTVELRFDPISRLSHSGHSGH
jgi:hypothetical protein